jgi:formiminotetrahydrofolate cyclodeaminase
MEKLMKWPTHGYHPRIMRSGKMPKIIDNVKEIRSRKRQAAGGEKAHTII